jgi:hypothetical protein
MRPCAAKRKCWLIPKWHELLTNYENAIDAEEQYDELLNLANEYCSRGIISSSERITLIEVATTAFTRSIAVP